MLFDAGYAGINWPKEYGGRGASPVEHMIFLEETERVGAPYVGTNFVGLLHAGPTIMTEASEEQKQFHLPAILKGEHCWCQGFSEPQAGSDLASLRTRAVRDGDEYVINGQKIWTSHAQVAQYCELLVRTDPDAPKHRGISWLIVPMDTPGIDIRPLETIRGSKEFSEVFFDDVRVPVANRVGDENDGWRVAMVTFSFERGTAFVSELLYSMQLVADLAASPSTYQPRRTAWRTGACAGRSATWPPSWTPSGRSPAATSARPPGTACPASAARCSSWPTPRPARSSATSATGCWTGRRCRWTTSTASPTAAT